MSITWIPGSRRRGGFEIRAYMGKIALGASVLAIIVYLIFPVIVVLAISFSAGNFLTFPPSGLSSRWYPCKWEA
jgi:ABC-type spermidine/putrescine transport system permease subunit II